MLKEHLSQEHDAARRFEIIDQQVKWILTNLLHKQPSKNLELCCGPGLCAARLAHHGRVIHGIDYLPASIEHAVLTAEREKMPCTYVCQDVRQAEFPVAMDLVMLIYGEFNVFRPSQVKDILRKAWHSLEPGGMLLLEPHPFHVIRQLGEAPASWYASLGGLFSAQPHIVLRENHWDTQSNTATKRYFVIDSTTGQVTPYAQSMQAYQDDEYVKLLSSAGFTQVNILPGLPPQRTESGLIAITAQKPYLDQDHIN
jgi:ubiquinone/menaquinone biosynthesis C-methylase UbiE